MDNRKLTRSRIALPSDRPASALQHKLKSGLVLTEPSQLLYTTLLGDRFAQFPKSVRMDVAMAVARLVDVESEPGEQKRKTEKCLENLKEIYELGGEKAVAIWCATIRECGCFLGSVEMTDTLSGAVRWARESVDQKNGGAREYLEVALVRAAESLREPSVLAVLETAKEENGSLREDAIPSLAVMFMAISARWGLEKARRVSETMLSLGMNDLGFLHGALQICGSSGSELDQLVDSLEKDGNVLWAVPEMNRGALEVLMRRPGEIIGAILRREGFPSEDLALTLVERQERLGLLSVMADSRALAHPDIAVRQAAMKRLTTVGTGTANPPFIRKIALKQLAGVWDDIPEEDAGRLKRMLMDPDDEKSPRILFATELLLSLQEKLDQRNFIGRIDSEYFKMWVRKLPVTVTYELALAAVHHTEYKDRAVVRKVAEIFALGANVALESTENSSEALTRENGVVSTARLLTQPWVARLCREHHPAVAQKLISSVILMKEKSRCEEVAALLSERAIADSLWRFRPEEEKGRETACRIAEILFEMAERDCSMSVQGLPVVKGTRKVGVMVAGSYFELEVTLKGDAAIRAARVLGLYAYLPAAPEEIAEGLAQIHLANDDKRFSEALNGMARPEVLRAIRMYGNAERGLSLAERLVEIAAEGEGKAVECAERVINAIDGLELPESDSLVEGIKDEHVTDNIRRNLAYVAASSLTAYQVAAGTVRSLAGDPRQEDVSLNIAKISDQGEDGVLRVTKIIGPFKGRIRDEKWSKFVDEAVGAFEWFYSGKAGKEGGEALANLMEYYSLEPLIALSVLYSFRKHALVMTGEQVRNAAEALTKPEVAENMRILQNKGVLPSSRNNEMCLYWIATLALDGEAAALDAARAFRILFYHFPRGDEIVRWKFGNTSILKARKAVRQVLESDYGVEYLKSINIHPPTATIK